MSAGVRALGTGPRATSGGPPVRAPIVRAAAPVVRGGGIGTGREGVPNSPPVTGSTTTTTGGSAPVPVAITPSLSASSSPPLAAPEDGGAANGETGDTGLGSDGETLQASFVDLKMSEVMMTGKDVIVTPPLEVTFEESHILSNLETRFAGQPHTPLMLRRVLLHIYNAKRDPHINRRVHTQTKEELHFDVMKLMRHYADKHHIRHARSGDPLDTLVQPFLVQVANGVFIDQAAEWIHTLEHEPLPAGETIVPVKKEKVKIGFWAKLCNASPSDD